jgi:hypothetical protein
MLKLSKFGEPVILHAGSLGPFDMAELIFEHFVVLWYEIVQVQLVFVLSFPQTWNLPFLQGDLLFILFKTGSCYVAQVGFKLAILLPLSPQCWNYTHAPLDKYRFLNISDITTKI